MPKVEREKEKKGNLNRHTVLLHNTKELDNDLRARSDQDLSLSRLLGVVDGIERIVEDGGLNHFCGRRFSNRLIGSEVSANAVY
jgi:hypothetical protein